MRRRWKKSRKGGVSDATDGGEEDRVARGGRGVVHGADGRRTVGGFGGVEPGGVGRDWHGGCADGAVRCQEIPVSGVSGESGGWAGVMGETRPRDKALKLGSSDNSMNSMKTVVLSIVVAAMAAMPAHGVETDGLDTLKTIFLTCRHVGGPTPSDDLKSYAEKSGISNAEMSEKLMALVKGGLDVNAGPRERHLAESGIYGLAWFGGEGEREFVLDIMRTADDKNFRTTAIRTGIRMVPDKWEVVVREVATDGRYGSYERFVAYEEAFCVGKHGDAETREQVKRVLSELSTQEPSEGNRVHLQKWMNELDAR